MPDNPLTRKYAIGDAVMLPDDGCPGCLHDQSGAWDTWQATGRLPRTGRMSGLITGYVSEADEGYYGMLADDGVPGPYYRVYVDHEHNNSGHLVYGESELATP